jgi:hypothetical protein
MVEADETFFRIWVAVAASADAAQEPAISLSGRRGPQAGTVRRAGAGGRWMVVAAVSSGVLPRHGRIAASPADTIKQGSFFAPMA